jgi:chromosome segregation ATPase
MGIGLLYAEDEVSAADAPPAPAAVEKSTSGPVEVPTEWEKREEQDFSVERTERGNWVLKKQIRDQAKLVMEEMRQLVMQMNPYEQQFLQQRNAADQRHNAFYQEYGFQASEVTTQLAQLEAESKKLEQDVDGVTPADKALVETLQRKKTDLKKLRDDLQVVQAIDGALGQAMGKLSAELVQVRTFEKEAWDSYEQISETLSDEVAETLYTGIKTHLQNIQDADEYIKTVFTTFFNDCVKSLDEKIQLLKNQMEKLKDQGVVLGNKITEQLKQSAAIQAALDEQRKREEEAAKQSQHWYTGAWEWIGNLFTQIGSWFTGAWQWLGGLVGG